MISELSRQRYFDTTIHIKKVKECITGRNEQKIFKLLQDAGFKNNKDFFRQYPIGNRFVLDFAFKNEQFAIEIDGKDHEGKKKKAMDKVRDKFIYSNNWVVLRIKDKVYSKYGSSFYFRVIRDVVEERRKQYQNGRLNEITIPDFNEKNYE